MKVPAPARKALQGLLERNHERTMERRRIAHQIELNAADNAADAEIEATLGGIIKKHEEALEALIHEMESMGLKLNYHSYDRRKGPSSGFSVSVNEQHATIQAIKHKHSADVKPIVTDDLDAQIAHLWLAEEVVEIKPLFNGELKELSEGIISAEMIEVE